MAVTTGKKEEKSKQGLLYKGKPLVRRENVICYGNATDRYVLLLTIIETKVHNGLHVATKVLVQLQSTDPNLAAHERTVKQTEKNSLYEALDVGEVWLERILTKEA